MRILDLKTVPDPAVAKRLLALEPFSDAEAVLAMTTLRVAGLQPPAAPLPLRRIVAATLVSVDADGIRIAGFDDADGEPALLAALEAEAGRGSGPVWTWSGEGVMRTQLLARALADSIPMPALLAQRGPLSLCARHGLVAADEALPEFAAAHGLPQQLGLRGNDTELAHAAGERERLRAGSAVDALIAHLLGLALQEATGECGDPATARRQVRDWLAEQAAPHWRAFLQHWKS